MSDWISVKDRLPEEYGRYLVVFNGSCEVSEFDIISQKFGQLLEEVEERDGFLYKVPYWDSYMHRFVTHWRPLPELPKEEAST